MKNLIEKFKIEIVSFENEKLKLDFSPILTAYEISRHFFKNDPPKEWKKISHKSMIFAHTWDMLVYDYSDPSNRGKVAEGKEEDFDREIEPLEKAYIQDIENFVLNLLDKGLIQAPRLKTIFELTH